MKLKRLPLFSSSSRSFRSSPTSALICASFLGSAALSEGAVIAYENFDTYSGWGGLIGENGGTGFSNAWYSGGAGSNIYSPAGNALGVSPAKRDLSAMIGDTGTIWLSFDWSCNDDTNGANTGATQEWGTFSFFKGASEIFAVGNPWHNNTWILRGVDSGVSDVGARKTGVIQFTLGEGATDSAKLWVGATGSPVDVSGAAAATVSGFNLSGAGTIRIMGTAEQTFDNLVIGTALLDAAATRSTAIWTNTGSSTWDTAGNWLDNVVGGSGKTADFSTLNITADTTVNLDSAVTIGNLVFGDTDTSSAAGWTLANNGNSDYILTLAGTTPTITVNALGDTKAATISAVVTGTEGLTKAGTGMLTLTGANTFTGNATVNAGTLQMQGTAFSTTARTYAIATGAVLNLDGNTGMAEGATTLSGTGTLRITNGTFANESPNEIKGDGRDITMAMGSGAVIDVQSGAVMYNGGWQNVTWTNNKADLNADGTFNLADGKSVFVDALTGAGSVTGNGTVGGDGGTQLLTVGVDNGSGTFSGALTGGIGLTKDGSGTQTLSGAINYSGATTVSEGTLLVSGQSYFNVGRTTTLASGAVLELNNSNNSFTSLMPISTVTGAGTFRLSGNSTINQELDGTVSTRLTFAMTGGLIDLLDTSKLTNGGWKELNWTDNKASMNITSGATFDIWDGNAVTIDALTGSGSVVKGHGGGDSTLLTVGVNDGSGTFSGNINITAGNFSLTKEGTGTQTLSGANTYTGTTTVSEGTLLINGNQSGATGAVSVASGATLGGNGTVGGATTISGTHAPGNSPGVQSFSGDLSYASTSIFEWDIASSAAGTRGPQYDGVNVGGTLSGTTGATFKVNLNSGAFTDPFWNTSRTWTDIFKAGVDGSGSALNIASVFSNITWYQGATKMTDLTGTEGSFTITGTTLNWTAVPEPTSALAGLLITAGLLRRRR